MFDGQDHASLAARVFAPRRVATRASTIVIYTGHPPVLEQIANQVRSSSGMTYGRATHDGAKMPPAFAFGPRR